MIAKSNEKPLISVVMPVKNGMPFLKQAVESILKDKDLNLELIISDDHSLDGSSQFLSTIVDPRVKVVSPSKPLPIDEHWTFVTNKATGKYLKLLCQDDAVTVGGLKRQVDALEANPLTSICVSSCFVINGENKKIFSNHGRGGLIGPIAGMDVIRKSFLSGTNILGAPSSLMFRKDLLNKVLPWDASKPYLLDFELYIRILESSDAIFLDTVDSYFRVHSNSLSASVCKLHYSQFTNLYREFSIRNTQFRKLNYFEMIVFRTKTYFKTWARWAIFKFFGTSHRF